MSPKAKSIVRVVSALTVQCLAVVEIAHLEKQDGLFWELFCWFAIAALFAEWYFLFKDLERWSDDDSP